MKWIYILANYGSYYQYVKDVHEIWHVFYGYHTEIIIRVNVFLFCKSCMLLLRDSKMKLLEKMTELNRR